MSDNELDNLFKEAAGEFKAPQDSSAWKNMSSRLDQAGVGATVFWNWKTISSIAAVGVTSVALIWYASQETADQPLKEISSSQSTSKPDKLDAETPGEKKSVELNIEKPSLVKSYESSDVKLEETKSVNRGSNQVVEEDQAEKALKINDNAKTEVHAVNPVVSSSLNESSINKMNQSPEAADKSINHREIENDVVPLTSSPVNPVVNSPKTQAKVSSDVHEKLKPGANEANLSVERPIVIDESKKTTTDRITDKNDFKTSVTQNVPSEGAKKSEVGIEQENSIAADSSAKPKKNLENPSGNDQQEVSNDKTDEQKKIKRASAITLKLSVAPDFSSINFFTPDNPGFNYGLMIGYSFTNRWSLYTGAVLSRKIYSSNEINEPYTSSGGYDYPVKRLDGDCRVLDVPINIYYTLFPENSFSIKAGIGISSYLMLSEDYIYHVDNQYGGPPEYSQSIGRKNNEWFKVMNVSVIMQKRLNSQFSLELEPFLKAPLAGVGEGEVSLVSLGAFFNVRFDIPIKKP